MKTITLTDKQYELLTDKLSEMQDEGPDGEG